MNSSDYGGRECGEQSRKRRRGSEPRAIPVVISVDGVSDSVEEGPKVHQEALGCNAGGNTSWMTKYRTLRSKMTTLLESATINGPFHSKDSRSIGQSEAG